MKRPHCAIVGTCSWLAGRAGAWIAGLALAWMALAPGPAWGQWTGGPSGPIYYNGGNVGLGTASPETRLHVEGWSVFHFDDWGNDTVIFRGQKSPTYQWGEYAIRTSYMGLLFRNTQSNATMLFLGRTGNVGIGTMSPPYLLAVNGTIGAREVIVTNTGWSDYVFRPGYRLRPLSEVGAYIRAHRRLPGIPSEAEVKGKGVNVGEMQAKLLAKIEELTLHIIQQEQRIAQLETRLSGR